MNVSFYLRRIFLLAVVGVLGLACVSDGVPRQPAHEGKNIVETAISAGTFKTLVTALKAADLVEALQGKGPFTVFAPTDEAFSKLPAGTLKNLLKPENKARLTAILTYHVVPGKIHLRKQTPATLEGRSVTIRTQGDFRINNADVIASDISASNGVIHVIDTVLIPPGKTLTPPQAARSVIALAVKRGVPLFNAGHHSACAAVYEIAVESLLKSHQEALGERDRERLQAALEEMRRTKGSNHQAWVLRRALDDVYQSLENK